MKRIMMMVIMTICLFTAFAQTEKGRFAISGNTDMSLIFAKTSLVMDSAAGENKPQECIIGSGNTIFL